MDKIKCHSCGKAPTTDSTYTLNGHSYCKNCYTHSERMLKEEVKDAQENDVFHFNNIHFDDAQQKVLITNINNQKNDLRNYNYCDILSYTSHYKGHGEINNQKQNSITQLVDNIFEKKDINNELGPLHSNYEYIDKLGVTIEFKGQNELNISFIKNKTKSQRAATEIEHFKELCVLLEEIISHNTFEHDVHQNN